MLNRSKYHIINNNHGTALVVTLAVAGILVAAAIQMGKFSSNAATSAGYLKDRFQAQQYAMAGIHLASLLLREDAADNEIDSVQEPWADPLFLEQAVEMMGLDNERLSLEIIDELSKIQVNALLNEFPGNQIRQSQAALWESFLHSFLTEEISIEEDIEPIMIINCVKDWLDSLDDDAVTGVSGAESDYYLSLETPYVCANGPFNHVDELLNVKGFSAKLFLNITASEDISEDIEDPDSIPVDLTYGDFFTVLGLDNELTENNRFRYNGRININTAPIEVIRAFLPEGMTEMAQDMVDFRDQKGEDDENYTNILEKNWYRQFIDLPEAEMKKFNRLIRYNSDIFKVESSGRQNSATVRMDAWLKREKDELTGNWTCRIIQMERK